MTVVVDNYVSILFLLTVRVGWSQEEIGICEGAGSVEVCVFIEGESVFDAIFTLATVDDGTATG